MAEGKNYAPLERQAKHIGDTMAMRPVSVSDIHDSQHIRPTSGNPRNYGAQSRSRRGSHAPTRRQQQQAYRGTSTRVKSYSLSSSVAVISLAETIGWILVGMLMGPVGLLSCFLIKQRESTRSKCLTRVAVGIALWLVIIAIVLLTVGLPGTQVQSFHVVYTP